MTEAAPAPAGTSDLLNAPAAPAPVQFRPIIGVPMSPPAFDAPEAVAARTTIDERKSDKDWYAKFKAERERGEYGPASKEWAELHQKGWPSAAPAIASQADVDKQAEARIAEHWNDFFGFLKQRWPVTPEQEAEIRGGVIREDLRQWAQEEKDRLIKDRGFYTRLINGDQAANEQWGRVTAMLMLRPVRAEYFTNISAQRVAR